MPLIEWTNALSVSVSEIDDQHQKLIAIINELYDSMRAGKGKEILSEILHRLKQYTQTHFGFEEQKMERFGYVDIAAHKREHAAFVAKVVEFSKAFNEGKVALTGELLNFLRDWLQTHIKGTDKKYSATFNQNGML
jgi:hemerythrin